MIKRLHKSSARTSRRALISSVPLLVLAVACTPVKQETIPSNAPSGGQTMAQLQAKLDSIPGLKFKRLEKIPPNVKGNTGFTFEMERSTDYVISNASALIDFLVRSAWSVRDDYMTNTSIEISLFGGSDPDKQVDLKAAAVESGWVPGPGEAQGASPTDSSKTAIPSNGFSHVSVWVDSRQTPEKAVKDGSTKNLKELGSWPGNAPAVPAALTVKKR